MGHLSFQRTVAARTVPSRPTDAGYGEASLTKIRVLLADDDPVERLRVSSVLAHAGVEVVAVATGHDVVDAVVAWEPNVVILSWPLEGGGLELVRQLVEELGMGGRVILSSAVVDVGTEHDALEAGAIHFVTRPAEPDRLIAAIRSAT